MISLPDLILPKIYHVGVSIDKTSLRAVQIDRTGHIRSMAEVQFPRDIFVNGAVSDIQLLSSAVKKLFETGGFTTPYVTVSFPESLAYTRGHSVPLIPLDEVAEAVSWKAKDIFPFPIEDMYFDWRIMEKTDKEYRVSVVAVRKRVIDELVRSLVTAGLKPIRFEPDASAVARLSGLKPSEYSLVTEMNKTDASITLVQAEKALFNAVVSVPPRGSSDSYLSMVVATQNDIVNFYKQKGLFADTVPSIELTGELAQATLRDEFASSTSFPVKLINSPVNNPAYNKAFAVASAPLVAPEDVQSINLLPSEMQRTYETERKDFYYRLILLRSAIALGVLCLASFFIFILVNLEKQSRDDQIRELTRLTQSAQAETQKLLLLNNQAKHIVALSPLRQTPKDAIMALGAILPDGITVDQWSYDSTTLTFVLKGVARAREDLLILKRTIESSDRFGKVDLPLVSLETPFNVKFSISFLSKM